MGFGSKDFGTYVVAGMVVAAIGFSDPQHAAANDEPNTVQQLCTYRAPDIPVWTGQDIPGPEDDDFAAYLDVIEGGGYGGPEPLRYDSRTGAWVDPVSGQASAGAGTELGGVVDAETGAQYLVTRGLWVDPETRIPLKNKRLNDVPYFDWQTGEMIDVRSGARSPYPDDLLTIGAQRQAAYNTRYACLGDDLSQRIDPVTRRYVERPGGRDFDTTFFPSFGETDFDRRLLTFQGERDAPLGFPRFNNFSKDGVRERFDLTNGESRIDVVGKIYAQMAPESAEGGGRYALVEQRNFDDGLTVLITATGLLDDAVTAEQFILFFDTAMDGRPRLMNAGVRRICGRPDSHAAWTIDPC